MPRTKTKPLTPTILHAAVHGLEIQRNKLDEKIEQLRALLGRRSPGRPARSTQADSQQRAQPQRRKLSSAARKRIAAAQKKRWAVIKAEQQSKEKSGTKRAAKKNNV